MDHPGFQRFFRHHFLALHQEGQGGLQANQVDHAHDTTAARQQAQANFRQTDLYRLVVVGNTVVGCQANLKAATEGRAVDGRHYRYRQLLQAAQAVFGHGQHFHKLAFIALFGLDQIIEVAAGKERFFGGGENNPGEAFFVLQFFNGGIHGVAVFGVHRVYRPRHIHGDCYDAVCVFFVIECAHLCIPEFCRRGF